MKSKGAFLFLIAAVTLGLVYISLITPSGSHDWRWPNSEVLRNFRLPRTLNAIGVGAALALSGLLLQTLLQNPLAEPYTLGLSGGATLGAVIGIIIFPTSASAALLFSFIGCWLAVALILSYHWRARHSSRRSLVLFGLMISLFCGSVVSLILSIADGGQLQRAMSWMVGSVGDDRGLRGAELIPVVLIIGLGWLSQARVLDVLLLGDDSAKNVLGNLRNLERAILLTVSILTSWAVASCGLIGFVGLLSPQISFLIFKTRRHRFNISSSMLIGAGLLLMADILGRVIGGSLDIPAGGVVALIGAPFLGWLLIQGTRP